MYLKLRSHKNEKNTWSNLKPAQPSLSTTLLGFMAFLPVYGRLVFKVFWIRHMSISGFDYQD